MTANLRKIVDANPKARIAYLVGSFHTSKTATKDGVKMTAKRIADAGIKAVTVIFTGGNDDGPRILTDAVRRAGLENSEFSLDMRPYASFKSSGIPFGAGEADFAIHLPQRFSRFR